MVELKFKHYINKLNVGISDCVSPNGKGVWWFHVWMYSTDYVHCHVSISFSSIYKHGSCTMYYLYSYHIFPRLIRMNSRFNIIISL